MQLPERQCVSKYFIKCTPFILLATDAKTIGRRLRGGVS